MYDRCPTWCVTRKMRMKIRNYYPLTRIAKIQDWQDGSWWDMEQYTSSFIFSSSARWNNYFRIHFWKFQKKIKHTIIVRFSKCCCFIFTWRSSKLYPYKNLHMKDDKSFILNCQNSEALRSLSANKRINCCTFR